MKAALRRVARVLVTLFAVSAGVVGAQDIVARGAYLAKLGNCEGCHTARGGQPYAGGKPIRTPFGTFHATNLTPDRDTGLGLWTANDFWRAMHEGVARGGRALYPVFPYPNYTRITRDDSDALFAYLRSISPVRRPNTPHELAVPYRFAWTLDLWRALFFRPETFVPDGTRSATWNRGAYLARGLGHCDACHAPRNVFGAVSTGSVEFAGGPVPEQSWHAPSLHDPAQGALIGWKAADAIALLRDGAAAGAWTTGPMSEIVSRSLQHWRDDDLSALAEFLTTLPPRRDTKSPASTIDPADPMFAQGERLYREHCKACHGAQGEGQPGRYPALANNRAITAEPSTNVLRIVIVGGYAPATRREPRPYGMPPFAQTLGDDGVAAVVTYIRNAWGHRAGAVTAAQANRVRGYPAD